MSTTTDATPKTASSNYDFVAWFYEALSSSFSFGQIYASKAYQIDRLKPGMKVLYVGAGAGEDVLLAVRSGADITYVDLSQKMLDLARGKVEAEELSAEWICGDIMEHNRPEHYDVVAANFFFNLFKDDVVNKLMGHLATLVKPGGRMLISDFAYQRGGWFGRLMQRTYWREANVFYWALGLCSLHPFYDYASFFGSHGLSLQERKNFPLTRIGPLAYDCLTAVKADASQTA